MVTSPSRSQPAAPVPAAPARFGLVVNSSSGAASTRAVQRLADALHAAGREAEIFPTTDLARGAEQAAAAISAGCDAVIACGGDGTVHEAMQAVIAAGGRVPLGILPLGTGNVIAHDLGISGNIHRAAALLLKGARRRVTVGRVETDTSSRYFLALAGVGCDAHALYHLTAAMKRRLGRIAYYLQSFRSLLTNDFAPFEAALSGPGGDRRETVSQVLAVRIADLGSMWRRLAPGASLERDDLRLVLFRGRGRLPYVRYMTAVVLGREPRVPGVEPVYATSVSCFAPAAPECVHVQADGEYLGRLPAHITVVPGALELLVARESQ